MKLIKCNNKKNKNFFTLACMLKRQCIPVVWAHTTVHHTYMFGYGLYFVDALFIIQYRLLLLLCC